jgi:hypothetical protein
MMKNRIQRPDRVLVSTLCMNRGFSLPLQLQGPKLQPDPILSSSSGQSSSRPFEVRLCTRSEGKSFLMRLLISTAPAASCIHWQVASTRTLRKGAPLKAMLTPS